MRYLDIAMLLIPEPNKIEVIRQIDEEVQLKSISYFNFPAEIAQLNFLALRKSLLLVQEILQKQETFTNELSKTTAPLRFRRHFPTSQSISTASEPANQSVNCRIHP